MSIRRGWEVELEDGTAYFENEIKWKEVPKSKIVRLTLHYDGRRWDLVNKQAYFVNTQASIIPGVQESFQVEKRTVGFYEGADKVHYIVDETSGQLDIKVINNG